MKRIMTISLVLLMLMFCGSLQVSAMTEKQDGLEFTLTAKKNTSDNQNQIIATLTVKNTNEVAVENIHPEIFIPDGYQCDENTPSKANIHTLSFGESSSLKVIGNAKTQTVEQNTETDTLNLLIMIGFIVLVVVLCVLLIVVLLTVRRKKAGQQMLSVLLILTLTGSMITVCVPLYTSAVEDRYGHVPKKVTKTVSLSENIKGSDKVITVKATVEYDILEDAQQTDPKAVGEKVLNKPYEEVVRNLIHEYGQGTITEEYTDNLKNKRYCLTGLGIVRQIDFDADGVSELLCCYGTSKNKKYQGYIELYSIVDGVAQNVYKGETLFYGSDPKHYLNYVRKDNKVLLQTTSATQTVTNDTWCELKNKRMEPVKVFKSDIINGDWKYTIDGVETDSKTFTGEYEAFTESKISMQLNDNTYENLNVMLSDTEELIKNVSHETKSTEKTGTQYTLLELADKTTSEIMDIMGGECKANYNVMGSILSFGNTDVLPGMTFYLEGYQTSSDSGGILIDGKAIDSQEFKDDLKSNRYKIKSIAATKNANVTDKITADMTYNQIADITGDFELEAGVRFPNVGGTQPPLGISLAYFYQVDNQTIEMHFSNEGLVQNELDENGQKVFSADEVRKVNPKLMVAVIYPQNTDSHDNHEENVSWKTSYKNKLNEMLNAQGGYMYFELCEIDNDDIPELILSQGGHHSSNCILYNIVNNTVNELNCYGGSYGVIDILPKKNCIRSSWYSNGVGGAGTSFAKIVEKEIVVSDTIYSYQKERSRIFTVNDKEVSEQVYNETAQKYGYDVNTNTYSEEWQSVGMKYQITAEEIDSVIDNF